MPHFIYILQCADDSYYVGHTENLAAREQAHNEGRGARYTAARRPVRIVYSETCESLDTAVSREQQIKRWSRAKKTALVEGNLTHLRHLSRRRS